jgi:hypothetical protein
MFNYVEENYNYPILFIFNFRSLLDVNYDQSEMILAELLSQFSPITFGVLLSLAANPLKYAT